MSLRLRSFRLAILALLICVTASCGGPVATGDLDKIQVEISPFYITVSNTSGRAVLDVRPVIIQVGGKSEFSTYLARLENDEKRDLGVNTFRNTEGVSFSPRTVKAASIVVTAKDIDGTALRIEVPWK
jgi:hypothetical protein